MWRICGGIPTEMTKNSQIPFDADSVAGVFDTYQGKARQQLLTLRRLIFQTAAKTEGVGELQETTQLPDTRNKKWHNCSD